MIDKVRVTDETNCQHDDGFGLRVTRIRTDTLSPEVPARTLVGFSPTFSTGPAPLGLARNAVALVSNLANLTLGTLSVSFGTRRWVAG